MAASGIENRGPFIQDGGCNSNTHGPSIALSFGSQVYGVDVVCVGGLLGGELPSRLATTLVPLGICTTQPQLCARRASPQSLSPPLVDTAAVVPGVPPAPARVDPRLCERSGDRFRVMADVPWCSTGIKLAGGERLRVTVQGRWSNVGPPSQGPQGFVGYQLAGTLFESADVASLIGRIGDEVFPISAKLDGRNGRAGVLELSINATPTFDDNLASSRCASKC